MEKPDKRRGYAAAFKAEALRLASESRSTQAVARVFHIDPKLLYKWQQYALLALPTGPSEAAEVRQLRAAYKGLAQELKILKKPLPFSAACRLHELLPVH